MTLYWIRNKRNNKVYVGQTQRLPRRWYEHRRELERGCHTNPHLQHAWDLEPDQFVFEVQRTVEDGLDSLLEIESIRFLRDAELVYNIAEGGEGQSRGWRPSAETLRRMSDSKRGIPKTPAHRAALSAARWGKPNPYLAERNRLTASSRRVIYAATSPTGITHIVRGREQLCALTGLSTWGVNEAIHGRTFRGWQIGRV